MIRSRHCASGPSAPHSPPDDTPTWPSIRRTRTSGTSRWRRAACGRRRTPDSRSRRSSTTTARTRCAACSSIRRTRTSSGSRPARTRTSEARRRAKAFSRAPTPARRGGASASSTRRRSARMAIDPRNSDVVWVAAQGPLWSAGGDRGLYKTTDGGQTWKPVLQISENTGVTDVVLDPRNPDVVYAAAYQRRRHAGLLIGGGPEGAIYKSTDGGATFKKLTNGLADRRSRPHRARDLAAESGRRLRVDHRAGQQSPASSVRPTAARRG